MSKKEKLIDVGTMKRGSDEYVTYIESLKNPWSKSDAEYYDFELELLKHQKYIAGVRMKKQQRKNDNHLKYILGGLKWEELKRQYEGNENAIIPNKFLNKSHKEFIRSNYPDIAKVLGLVTEEEEQIKKEIIEEFGSHNNLVGGNNNG